MFFFIDFNDIIIYNINDIIIFTNRSSNEVPDIKRRDIIIGNLEIRK